MSDSNSIIDKDYTKYIATIKDTIKINIDKEQFETLIKGEIVVKPKAPQVNKPTYQI